MDGKGRRRVDDLTTQRNHDAARSCAQGGQRQVRGANGFGIAARTIGRKGGRSQVVQAEIGLVHQTRNQIDALRTI